ncbi:Fpg/Nei family DNA glycosylase [Cohnella fermenti]|uniref:Formamidopyrimidine-DNA glycosylase n=1 Tax=Cohnella fermenti TaxID=2565925 RepID=A0A4S4BPR8_9BACL|nr:DNA-formamidopyrimidine glycosylase family protein [Cohnella fermenti]THF74583.1 Fpg/Nei family DNA glycosylase [Cohnella fermenti]
MSDWPEIDAYRRQLSPLLCGLAIREVEVGREQAINEPIDEFASHLNGRKVLFVERRGRQLLLHLDDGNRVLFALPPGGWLHLGPSAPEGERAQIALSFEDGETLFAGGPRAVACHRLSAKSVNEMWRGLGPDPFDARLTEEAFVKRLSARRGKLKATLVDQKLVSGIGGAYADEICFEAEVLPAAPIPELADETKRRIYRSMRKVLEEAAADPAGFPFRVHGREGEACPRCGGTIRQEALSSKKMTFCPSCQKEA